MIETARLALRLAHVDEAAAVARYWADNRERFRPTDPPRDAEFTTEPYWKARLELNRQEAEAGESLRLYAFAGARPIAAINFTQVRRGPQQACTLGFGVDGAHEGRGYMSEALRAATAHVFDAMRLHRIEANHLPENLRSGRLLLRLGFEVQGYAKRYLYINGAWRDHVMTALTSADDAAPRCRERSS